MNHSNQPSEFLPEIASLKQKPPFRFIDYVESLDIGQGSIVAWMAEHDEQSFRPKEYVPPYVVLEALAQASSFLVMSQLATRRGYVVGFDSINFSYPISCKPLRLQAKLLQVSHPFYTIDIGASCEGHVVAEGQLRVYVEI
ncbi:hypothetical protein ACO0K7_14700 [Undibacterium sp. Ji67W]|uniref:hypothetical protein n=1 Tax=Undibacterium sp. Ji67W TaxID=3413042 RepID=UPI003BF23430